MRNIFKCQNHQQISTFYRVLIISFGVLLLSCSSRHEQAQEAVDSIMHTPGIPEIKKANATFIRIPRDIKMKTYFSFFDSLVSQHDTLSIKLTEHTIVHANPWLLDSLRNSDYYVQKKKGFLLYNQAEKIMLHQGDSLMIPDSAAIARINQKLKSTILDLNIPEFTLRVIQLDDTILISIVRVGRNAKQFLPLVGDTVNLRTPIGKGKIIRIERSPTYINPDTGEKFEVTKRDDGEITKMPIIPWIEPIINGVRFGTMIHPTTNPRSLGKPYSHGCVGTTEADAWTIYYNCPLGTKVIFRYNLKVRDPHGDTLQLKDIYQLEKSGNTKMKMTVVVKWHDGNRPG